MQLLSPHKLDHVRMADGREAVHQWIGRQQRLTATGVSGQQLAVDRIVPGGLVPLE